MRRDELARASSACFASVAGKTFSIKKVNPSSFTRNSLIPSATAVCKARGIPSNGLRMETTLDVYAMSDEPALAIVLNSVGLLAVCR